VDLEVSHTGCIPWWRNERDDAFERGEEVAGDAGQLEP